MTIQDRINKLKSQIIKGMIIASPLLPVRGSAQTQQGFDEIKEKMPFLTGYDGITSLCYVLYAHRQIADRRTRVRLSLECEPASRRFNLSLRPTKKPPFQAVILLVGVTGFEPATSTSRT